MRHSLLNLARNCSREWPGVHMDRVELQAATLEKITNKPEQATATTNSVHLVATTAETDIGCVAFFFTKPQLSAIDFASEITNLSKGLRTVSQDTRLSLVKVLSQTLDAGVLDGDGADSITATTVLGTLGELHLLSTPDLAPGEHRLVTQAPSLALGSQKAGCFLEQCTGTIAEAPLFDREVTRVGPL